MPFIEEETIDPNEVTFASLDEEKPADKPAEDPPKEDPPKEDTPPVDDSAAKVADAIPDKYKNKSIEDIIKMHQEAEKKIGHQAQEVHEVRTLADQLIKRQLEPNKPADKQENTSEIDFFENPTEAMKRAVENNPAVLEAKQASIELKKMKTAQQLAAKHPDFATIAADTGFHDWVKASKVRMGLYTKADAEFDFEAADELLSTYKELKQVKATTQASATKAAADDKTAQALKAAATDDGGSGEVSRKVYRRADLIRLKMTDPDRYEQLQPEIMAAYVEGRVK